MPSNLRLQAARIYIRAWSFNPTRSVTTLSGRSVSPKAAGDISSVFPSLSGAVGEPLPPRFADLKARLINGYEDRVRASWERLLADLREETEIIRVLGPSIVPEINFRDISNVEKRTVFRDGLRKRGVAVVRGVVTEKEALDWKELVKRYIKTNPSTKGFPADKPAVYELYWSPSQVIARAHPNLLRTQAFLMSHWHSVNKTAMISTSHPVSYADRLRIRQPGDAGFALGPHCDAGSVERWEEDGYGQGGAYNKVFQGDWEDYDPWESSCRLPVASDLYNGPGGCSMLRMFQGWLSMSETGPGEGTLMVNPLLSKATAYSLLRPFFAAKNSDMNAPTWLQSNNWNLERPISSLLHGAVPGTCQELNAVMHPHLMLDSSMVHVPRVRPGDYVAWHCDTIHAVDKIHAGNSDASVMYIPACPLTEGNAEYLLRQRETLLDGTPGPDFPSGKGESQHRGRLTSDYVMQNIKLEAQQAMGLAKFPADKRGVLDGENRMLQRANEILGFA